jgi:hypothetical protein
MERRMIFSFVEQLTEMDYRLLRASPDQIFQTILDCAIEANGADKGTLQHFDETADCLRIIASRGFTSDALKYFAIVRRHTNSSCAAALTQRMRIIVPEIATSYLFVGRPELKVLRDLDIAAVHSAPIVDSSGRLRGVISIHFRRSLVESLYDPTVLERFAGFAAKQLKNMYR